MPTTSISRVMVKYLKSCRIPHRLVYIDEYLTSQFYCENHFGLTLLHFVVFNSVAKGATLEFIYFNSPISKKNPKGKTFSVQYFEFHPFISIDSFSSKERFKKERWKFKIQYRYSWFFFLFERPIDSRFQIRWLRS